MSKFRVDGHITSHGGGGWGLSRILLSLKEVRLAITENQQ